MIKGKGLCVLGKYITLAMVHSISANTLVGKLEFVKLSRLELLDWVREKWKPLIKTILRVLMLMKGWF